MLALPRHIIACPAFWIDSVNAAAAGSDEPLIARRMSLPHPVALQGFRAFERSSLASYFRLASNRSPAYEQVEAMADAQFLIVDADQPDAVAAATSAGRLADSVFIGDQAPAATASCLARPIDPLKVLRELDALVARVQAQQEIRRAATAPPTGLRGPRTVIRTPRPLPVRGTGFVAIPTLPPPPVPLAPRHSNMALLVDDSEIALRFLETRLQPLGLCTERATSSGKALERLARQTYDFIFIDVDLGDASELDGMALCQHLKRQHHHAGDGPAPLLAIVSAFHSEVDRARGALAGADAYFGKPLDEVQLETWLREHGIMRPPLTDIDIT
jgi:CheY-like chemotaxis protein